MFKGNIWLGMCGATHLLLPCLHGTDRNKFNDRIVVVSVKHDVAGFWVDV
jgi:hypothetical protein